VVRVDSIFVLQTVDYKRLMVVLKKFVPLGRCEGVGVAGSLGDIDIEGPRRGAMMARARWRCAATSFFFVVLATGTGVGVAGASGGFTFVGGNASITVSWSGSVSGPATLMANVGASAKCSATVSSAGTANCVIAGLVNGTSYTVSASVTSNGSTLATSSAVVTPYTRPDPVSAIRVQPGNGQATVDWTPGATGGASVSYTATAVMGTTQTSCSTIASSCTITGLVNGVTYDVSVTAQNSAGSATASGGKVTPRTTPGVVTGLTVSRNATDEPVLKWRGPSDDGGSVVTGYEVLNETNGSGAVLVTTASTSVTLVSVGNGAGMTFAVAAQNAAGTGAVSSVSLGAPVVSRTSTFTVRKTGTSSVTVTIRVLDSNQIGIGGVSVVINARGKKTRSWSSTSDAQGIVTQRIDGLSGVESFSANAGGVNLGNVTLSFGPTATTSTTWPLAGPTTVPVTGSTVPATDSTTSTVTSTTTTTTTTTTVAKREQFHISFGAAAGLRLARYHVAVSGHGFAAGTRVVVVVKSTPRELGSVIVGPSGAFEMTVHLSHLVTGVHHLVVTAYQGQTNVAQVTYTFQVLAGILTSRNSSELGQYAPYSPSREKKRTLEAALGVLVGLAALRATTRRRTAELEDVELERYGDDEENESEEGRGWLATLSQKGPARLARLSPVMGRVLNDGEYLRGLVAWGWSVLVGLSLATGIATASATHFEVVPGWLGFAVILVLGILDATLGYAAGLAFVGSVALAGHLASANDVRLAMGLILVWFAVPLGAASVAALRRKFTKRVEDLADRLGDLIVGGLFGAWLAVKMTAALSVLAGVDLPLSHDGSKVVALVLVTLVVRLGLETWAAHGERLSTMTRRGELESSKTQMAISLVVQMAAFWFVSSGSLGASWTLGIGEGVFFAPLVAWLWVDRLPKNAWLGTHAARGVAKWSIVIAVGVVLATVLGHGTASVQLDFVLLPLPILAFWTLELFEDQGALAAKLSWTRRVVGLALVALCVGLVLGN
jgi:hypothetical protein